MEEPAKLEEPFKPSPESVNVGPQVSPESSTTNAPNESPIIEDASHNATHPPGSETISLDTPKQCGSGADCQDSKVDKSLDGGGQSIDHPPIDAAIPSQSGCELGAVQVAQSNATMDSPSCPRPLEACPIESLEPSKSGPDAETLSSTKPIKVGVESHEPLEILRIEARKPTETETESPMSSQHSAELGSESPKASTLTSESGVESPKSPYPLESSPESPKSIASNESGESAASESSQSQKSGSSSDFVRRKSKLMESYSIRRPSKLNQLETQLELVASEREKDIIVKQEYKVQEESLKEKRESIIKEMHKEERKAKMEKKASFRAGTSLRVDLNASRRDSRKDDLNRKKEEDERNKQLILQRARDEKNLRKSIYQSSSKTPSAASSQSSPSPPPEQKD